jgi:manganese-transporting P-type ATPase
MITGDNPLTACHVARDVEIVDREVMILDQREGATSEKGNDRFSVSDMKVLITYIDLVWRTIDESKIIPVDLSKPIDPSIWKDYDICMTGVALKQFEGTPQWNSLVQHCWVYARVSPYQKEYILTTLKSLGYVTLMAGDGTNDVGALKQANVGVALLDGSPEDLKKIAEHNQKERLKKVYETQLKMSARFNQPPPPPPKLIADMYPDLVETQKKMALELKEARKRNPMENVSLISMFRKRDW